MPIRWVAGDLFANAYKVRALAHGCNCQGSMGAGIAKGFRERYPAMYQAYRARCKARPRQFNLGDAWLWKDARRPWVFNLGTQESYWRARASYEAIEQSLRQMRALAEDEGVGSIAMPRIGVGHGGLSWKKVRPLIERVFGDWPFTLVAYEKYTPRRLAETAGRGARPAGSHLERPDADQLWQRYKANLGFGPGQRR